MYSVESLGGTEVIENNYTNWNLSKILRLEKKPCGVHHVEFGEDIYRAYVWDHGVKHTCISAQEKPTFCVIPYEEVMLQSIIF